MKLQDSPESIYGLEDSQQDFFVTPTRKQQITQADFEDAPNNSNTDESITGELSLWDFKLIYSKHGIDRHYKKQHEIGARKFKRMMRVMKGGPEDTPLFIQLGNNELVVNDKSKNHTLTPVNEDVRNENEKSKDESSLRAIGSPGSASPPKKSFMQLMKLSEASPDVDSF